MTIPLISLSVLLTGCSIFMPGSGEDDKTSTETPGDITTSQESASVTTETAETVSESDEKDIKNGIKEYKGVYLGVNDYGAPETDIANVSDFRYGFDIDGEKMLFKISAIDGDDEKYTLQNKLKKGYTFEIKTDGSELTDVEETGTDAGSFADPVVKGVPGERTLKNFLKTALMPVGSTLYIYGGGWDWQDEGASAQACTIGVSGDWSRFFASQDAGYTYKDKDGKDENKDASSSYYPYGHFNEYYFAGLDCSGFLGWTLYNTFENEDGKEGYVFKSTENSRRLADKGWGSLRQTMPSSGKRDESSVHPGDVISIKGHVWISLGTCKDGSVVMVHSSPSFSREGQPGGGVQIAAVGYSKDCKAYELAKEYMSGFYPEWYERYDADLKSPDLFLGFEGDDAGIFSWDTNGAGGGLTDPEGFRNMDPVKILKLLYEKRR